MYQFKLNEESLNDFCYERIEFYKQRVKRTECNKQYNKIDRQSEISFCNGAILAYENIIHAIKEDA